jgi:hypothetical protein
MGLAIEGEILVLPHLINRDALYLGSVSLESRKGRISGCKVTHGVIIPCAFN